MISGNMWENTQPAGEGRLSYLSLACTTHCNLECAYCSKKDSRKEEHDPDFLFTVLDAALELGLEKVELTGGEPLLYPYFEDVVTYLVEKNVTVLIVTNGTLLDRKMAAKLAAWGVGVAVSLSTLDHRKFDRISGTRGLLKKVTAALDYLKEEGYSSSAMPVLALQSIASTDTLVELNALREFARQKDCQFILNRAIPVGGLDAVNVPTGKELKELLMRENCDTAEVSVPFSADTPCNRLAVGCYISSGGLVKPCPSLEYVAGDLRQQSLADIWNNSPLLRKTRRIYQYLEGSCGACPENRRCYGCRAAAFAVWGKLTAPDPGCFRFNPDGLSNATRVCGEGK